MRRFKQKFRRVFVHGKWWREWWLYEKIVIARIPDDVAIKQLVLQGKIERAANLMTTRIFDMFKSERTMLKVEMPISRAILAKELKTIRDWTWNGKWAPTIRLYPKKGGEWQR